MAVFSSHVACSHPANCDCEKRTEKYVHSVTYFPYATIQQAIIWVIVWRVVVSISKKTGAKIAPLKLSVTFQMKRFRE